MGNYSAYNYLSYVVSHRRWRAVSAGLNITTSDEQSLSFDPKTGRFIYSVKRFGAGGRAVALVTIATNGGWSNRIPYAPPPPPPPPPLPTHTHTHSKYWTYMTWVLRDVG